MRLFAAALICLAAGSAIAAEYGPLRGGFYVSVIDERGRSAWGKAVAETLTARGFAEPQVQKFSRLYNWLMLPEDRQKRRIEFNSSQLPITYNPETGAPMPLDPVAFAKAIPDCLAQDESVCTFTYSTSQTSRHANPDAPCLIPKRTAAFCRRVGLHAGRLIQQLSCGEQPRPPACGADLAVFDTDKEQIKLESAVARMAKIKATPADPPPPIVYRLNKVMDFVSRSGPPGLEEWELDIPAFAKLRDGSPAQLSFIKRNLNSIKYCWPHDVLQPCNAP